jgi:hypothetical protein
MICDRWREHLPWWSPRTLRAPARRRFFTVRTISNEQRCDRDGEEEPRAVLRHAPFRNHDRSRPQRSSPNCRPEQLARVRVGTWREAATLVGVKRRRVKTSKAPRQPWRLRQRRQFRICNLQILQGLTRFESHPLPHQTVPLKPIARRDGASSQGVSFALAILDADRLLSNPIARLALPPQWPLQRSYPQTSRCSLQVRPNWRR